MRRHPAAGERILRAAPAGVASIVRSSHERHDGTGYPDRAKREIPIGARIIAVRDSFDAIISDRPYATPRTPQQAADERNAAPALSLTRPSSRPSWPSSAPARRPLPALYRSDTSSRATRRHRPGKSTPRHPTPPVAELHLRLPALITRCASAPAGPPGEEAAPVAAPATPAFAPAPERASPSPGVGRSLGTSRSRLGGC
jgi:hypothetical protein